MRRVQNIGQRGSGQGQFQWSDSSFVDQRDRLIVADHLNHRVVLLDQASTWLLTIKVMSLVLRSLRAHMVLPWIFKGTSMLPPMFSSTIKVFSPEGTYVRSYGSVHHPSGIVVDDKGYSLVIEKTDNYLSIFKSFRASRSRGTSPSRTHPLLVIHAQLGSHLFSNPPFSRPGYGLTWFIFSTSSCTDHHSSASKDKNDVRGRPCTFSRSAVYK